MGNVSRRALLTGLAATISAPAVVRAANTPNVVLMIADDLSSRMLTRALPQLSARPDLKWYPNCFSEVSQCDPARYTMYSGQRAALHRVTDNTNDRLFDWTNALHGWFKQVGYTVGHIGNWTIRTARCLPSRAITG
jgi:arylsulfatase A-like enzyme